VASHFALNSSGLPLQLSLGNIPTFPHDGHQKVLLSNLGLTVFVRHLVKQVP
jgi:hypothetical protein